jgi:hypothetical protein
MRRRPRVPTGHRDSVRLGRCACCGYCWNVGDLPAWERYCSRGSCLGLQVAISCTLHAPIGGRYILRFVDHRWTR